MVGHPMVITVVTIMMVVMMVVVVMDMIISPAGASGCGGTILCCGLAGLFILGLTRELQQDIDHIILTMVSMIGMNRWWVS